MSDTGNLISNVCIAVPSYRRPHGTTVRRLQPCPYDKFLCVRPDEVISYTPVAQATGFEVLTLENVSDIGNTRQRLVEKLSKNYEWVFMLDDDLSYIELLGQRDGKKKAQRIIQTPGVKPSIEARALSEWLATAKRYEFSCSTPTHHSDWSRYGTTIVNKAVCGGAVLLHTPSILEVGNYKSNYEIGFEDVYMQYKLMRAGKRCATVGSITFQDLRDKGGCMENIYKNGREECHILFTDLFLKNVCDDTNLIRVTYPFKNHPDCGAIRFNWRNWNGYKIPCDIPEV